MTRDANSKKGLHHPTQDEGVGGEWSLGLKRLTFEATHLADQGNLVLGLAYKMLTRGFECFYNMLKTILPSSHENAEPNLERMRAVWRAP